MMKHPKPYERPDAEALELGPMLDVCQDGGSNTDQFNRRAGQWSTSPYNPDDDYLTHYPGER